MMTTEQVQAALEDMNLLAVARGCGVSYETVRKIAQGKADNVRHSSVVAVAKYLDQRTQK